MSALLILGAGGHGKVVAECAEATGRWDRIAFLDDGAEPGSTLLGWPVLGAWSMAGSLSDEFEDAFSAVGDNALRLRSIDRLGGLGYRIPGIVHPSAVVFPSAALGAGVLAMPQVVVSAAAEIGDGVLLNSGASVGHDSRLGRGVHFAPGARCGGECRIGARGFFGVNVAVNHQITTGEDVVVGSGSAIYRDLPARVTAIGVPARIVKRCD